MLLVTGAASASERTQCLVPTRRDRRAQRSPDVCGHAAVRDRRVGGTGCRATAPPPLAGGLSTHERYRAPATAFAQFARNHRAMFSGSS
jgi:hypothetical protein